MKFKRLISAVAACAMVVSMAGCASAGASSSPAPSSSAPAETSSAAPSESAPAAAPSADAASPSPASTATFSADMVTDTGGVNDQSFNQSAWEGLQQAKTELGMNVKYLESKQTADYASNLDKLSDEKPNVIWGIGYLMHDSILAAAQQNPDMTYAIIDSSFKPEDGKNLIGVMFRAQESSFLVGYIAAKTTKADKVGFIGGMKSDLIDQFEYGYRAGVAYGAKELGKKIDVSVAYAESFSDDAKGKALATQMYSGGCDIIFHAAGNVGKGVFDEAKEVKKYVIGVDRDQSDSAPDQCLTSAMKFVGKACYLVSKDLQDGKAIGGSTITYGLKEGGVGIPDNSKLVDPKVMESTKTLEQSIIDGKIVVPYNQETLDSYVATLK